MTPERIAPWPVVRATITVDSSATAVVNIAGRVLRWSAPTVDAVRAAIITRAAQLARSLHRPVALEVAEGSDKHRLAVRSSGVVQLLQPDGTVPPADHLKPVTGACISCAAQLVVSAELCPGCGIPDPLSLDATTRTSTHPPATTPPTRLVEPAASNAAASEGVDAAPAKLAQLVIHLGTGEAIATTAPVVVGREPDPRAGHASILVASPGKEVSRSHIVVDVDDRGTVIVTDQRSANGTYIDGKPLAPATPTIIPAGARISIGDVDLRVDTTQPGNSFDDEAATAAIA